jgi:hypothetical protein
VREVLPTEAENMTVDEALKAGEVGGRDMGKLLQDTREKFTK